MVYNTENYWVFERRPSSGIQSRCLPSHLKTETDTVSETSCSLVSRISEDGQKVQKPSNSEYSLT
jgi:hypothetical protein